MSLTSGAPWRLRPGRDCNGPALIALIASCWSAYPSIRMDVDREMPELRALATYYADRGGVLLLAETDDAIAGMIAARPLQGQEWEICRLYVDPQLHGSGLGHALLDLAEHHAATSGALRLTLWSDTRFDRAHHFYEKRSYVRQGPVRVLNDLSNSLEYRYAKPINGTESLDVAAVNSAVGRLTEILVACVDGGDAAPFLKPFTPAKARAFWQRAASDVAADKGTVLAAWRGGTLDGVGVIDLDTPDAQGHCGKVQMILVHPNARQDGTDRQILRSLERAAVARGRTMLTLETQANEAREALVRAEGWQESGRIPGFERDSDGNLHTSIFFWKQLAG